MWEKKLGKNYLFLHKFDVLRQYFRYVSSNVIFRWKSLSLIRRSGSILSKITFPWNLNVLNITEVFSTVFIFLRNHCHILVSKIFLFQRISSNLCYFELTYILFRFPVHSASRLTRSPDFLALLVGIRRNHHENIIIFIARHAKGK